MFSLQNKKILAIGPHPDDIELGCFGTLARLSEQNQIYFLVLTDGELKDPKKVRVQEAQAAAELIQAEISFCHFVDGKLKDDSVHVQVVEQFIDAIGPDIVLVSAGNDSNQDHRACFNLVLAASREIGNLVMYDTGSSTQFSPNVFMDITGTFSIKCKAVQCHHSQFPQSVDAGVEAQARFYGYKLRQPGRLFEGFEVVRWVM